MARATTGYSPRLAAVFDFDKTLAPDSFSTLLNHLGIDGQRFEQEEVQPLVDAGWHDKLAQFHLLIERARQESGFGVGRDDFTAVGRQIELFPGVLTLFDRLRECAHAVDAEIDLRFYLLTAGMVEIPEATPIAGEFEAIWGGGLHFDEAGRLSSVTRVVTHAEKTRYLLQLARGTEDKDASLPADAQLGHDEKSLFVPLDQMIFVGDGASDLPAFSLLHGEGGIPIGIFEGESPAEWKKLEEVHPGRRVENLVRANYEEGSEMMVTLRLAVESIGKRMRLRRLGAGK